LLSDPFLSEPEAFNKTGTAHQKEPHQKEHHQKGHVKRVLQFLRGH
jgi:hypothetical protein